MFTRKNTNFSVMKRIDVILIGAYVVAFGGMLYWLYKDINRKPRELTPEEVQMRLEEYWTQQAWLAEDGYYG